MAAVALFWVASLIPRMVHAVPTATFTLDVDSPTTPFPHYWEECVGSGHAALALRADWQRQLKQTHADLGTRMVRFHGIFDADVGIVAGVGADGTLRLNFTNLDRIYDGIIAAGVVPYVELSFMPPPLASGATTYLHYKANVTPPRNMTQWAELMYSFGSHLVERYGEAEVSTWLFEVWNEPNLRNIIGPFNLPAFWAGNQSQYFDLYAHTVSALKRVSPSLQVGGPTTAGGAWIPEFLAYTKAHSLPVDFVSIHAYPTDLGNGQDVNALEDSIRAGRDRVGPSRRLVLSEYDSGLYNFADNNDQPFAASFVARNIPLIQRYNLEVLSYWTFSDIFEEIFFDSTPFHDGYGLLTVQGVPKPAYRAFQILHTMGTKQLPVQVSSVPSNTSVHLAATTNGTHVQLLLSNFHTPIDLTPAFDNWTAVVHVSGVDATEDATVAFIDDNHTNPVATWKAMGSPNKLSASQLAELMQASELQHQNLTVTPTHQQAEAGMVERGIPDAGAGVSFELNLVRQATAFVSIPLPQSAA